MNVPLKHPGGPKTPEGKAVSRMNAIKHGGRTSTLIEQVVGEERFEQLRAEMIEECRPVGPLEEALAGQMAQCALQADFTGLQLRAALRDVTRTCDALTGTGSPEAHDAALRMSAEAPAVLLAARYNALSMSGFFRAHAQLRALQTERLGHSPALPADAAIESPPARNSRAMEKLLEILSDSEQRAQFLWELRWRWVASATAEDNCPPPLDAAVLAAALKETFLAKTGLEPRIALLFAAESISNPEATVSALCERAGLRRRETALKLRDHLRSSGEATRDWVLRGLEAYFSTF